MGLYESNVNYVPGKVPELKLGRFHGKSEGANSACGFLCSFAHAACHFFNKGSEVR